VPSAFHTGASESSLTKTDAPPHPCV
jgi:hypothetical protein